MKRSDENLSKNYQNLAFVTETVLEKHAPKKRKYCRETIKTLITELESDIPALYTTTAVHCVWKEQWYDIYSMNLMVKILQNVSPVMAGTGWMTSNCIVHQGIISIYVPLLEPMAFEREADGRLVRGHGNKYTMKIHDTYCFNLTMKLLVRN